MIARLRGLLVGLGVVGVGMLFLLATLRWGSVTPDYDAPRSVYLLDPSDWGGVRSQLESGGVLSHPARLTFLARATGWEAQIKPGHYAIPAGMSAWDILQKLRRGERDPIRLLIPPGLDETRLYASIVAQMAFDSTAFAGAVQEDGLFAELGIARSDLPGYLFAETYFVYWLSDPETLLQKVVTESIAYAERLERTSTNPFDLSAREAIIMASIVEWEALYDDEKPRIAGVYLNRLRDRWPLQADPTIQHIILEQEGQKRRLFFKDYDIPHPYNTYLRRGLPPGPVTNPSRTSLTAVFEPERHDYYYFVATGDGRHRFSRTLSEHQRAAQAYYRTLRERR